MSGHFPAISEILRKYLSRTEISLGPFLRESTTRFQRPAMFFIFFELSSSNGGSTKAVPVCSCRQPVFGINSPRLLYLCSFSPTPVPSVVILGTVFPRMFSELMSQRSLDTVK